LCDLFCNIFTAQQIIASQHRGRAGNHFAISSLLILSSLSNNICVVVAARDIKADTPSPKVVVQVKKIIGKCFFLYFFLFLQKFNGRVI
jgi:hypothetical protein